MDINAAVLAGQLAVEAQELQDTIGQINAAAGASIISVTMVTDKGQRLNAAVPLSVADSTSLLRVALNIYQNMLSAVLTELQGM